MKNKISRILGVGLSLMLLASLMVVATPTAAQPPTLSWLPDKQLGDMASDYILLGSTNITDVATCDDVIYVGTDNSDYPLLKSIDGGSSWSNLKTTTDFPSGDYVVAAAVAPDDEDIVAFIASSGNVCYSSDGGSSWDELSAPSTTDNYVCIDVVAGTERYLVIGGDDGSSDDVIYTLKLSGLAQSWEDRTTDDGFDDSGTSVLAVKFSPNFVTDKIITAVSANADTAMFQVFWYESEEWNDHVTGYETGYPIEIASTDCQAADIAMVDTYLGTDEYERTAFVSLAGGIGLTGDDVENGLWRLIDYSPKAVQSWAGGASGPLYSISYHPDGKVLAGDYDSSTVYMLEDAFATTPKFGRLNSLKQPGGYEKAVVAWAGDNAVAGTYGDESAFALSTDDGYSWNDVAVIDTALTTQTDVAVNADGSKVYLASYDGNDVSIWLKQAGSWSRVLSLMDETSTRDLLVRIAPDDDAAVYIADTNSQDIWVSQDSGLESWKSVTCYKLGEDTEHIVDMAVESADVVYVIDDDGCSKSSNAGSSWGKQTSPDDTVVPYMITMAPNGDVLIGGVDGYVAFSNDGGATWERTSGVAGGSNLQVVADDDYADNNIIYAGSGNLVYRGAADTTTPWTDTGCATDSSSPGDTTIVGMYQYEEVTYVIAANGTDSSYLYRALALETGKSDALCQWSGVPVTFNNGDLILSNASQAMKVSVAGTTTSVYAIVNGLGLMGYNDPIALAGPTLKAPAEDYSVKVNDDGTAYNVTFNWERYSDTDITKMQLQISTDADFTAIIYDEDDWEIESDSIAKVIGPTGLTDDDVSQEANFNPGDTYYWRVRVAEGGPMYSPWSETRSFTVDAVDDFVVTGPTVGATDVSITPTLTWAAYEDATGYEIMLAEDPTFAILDWSHTSTTNFYASDEALKYSTTYYWRVRASEPEVGPWVSSVFTTMAEPTEETITVTMPEGEEQEIVVEPIIEVTTDGGQAIPTSLLWVIIVIGAVLIIALIVLIVRTRRVA